MNKLTTRLVLSITLVGGMLLSATQATAQQQLVAPSLQLVESSTPSEASQLRAGDRPLITTSKYVATDIYGKKHDIDAILKSGKSLLIDFSTLWCKWCWKLHKSGVLDRIYAKFGPEGTKELELFWVEVEGASKSRIQASGKDWTKDNMGEPIPYAIISEYRMNDKLGIPVEGLPTVVLISKEGRWTECRQAVQGDLTLKEFDKLLTSFITQEDKPQALKLSGETDLYSGETYTMRLSYKTISPVTSVDWKAPEGVTLQKVSDTEYKVTADKVGSYEIVATVTNGNGSSEGKVIVSVSKPISNYPFVSRMDVKNKLDKGWRSIDHDGDGYGFDSFMGEGYLERLALSFTNSNYKPGAEHSADHLISWGKFLPTATKDGGVAGVTLLGKKIEPKNELLSAPMLIPADAAKPTFSCYIARVLAQGMARVSDEGQPDQLKVMVSELNGTPVELLVSPQADDDWQLISADLSAYKGKTIQLSLIPVVNGTSGLSVDQIRVTMDGKTDVEAPTLSLETTLYPNPASDYVTVRTRVGSTIELFAADGTMLSTTQATGERTTIALAQLPAGRYIARITSLEGEVVFRPLIIK